MLRLVFAAEIRPGFPTRHAQDPRLFVLRHALVREKDESHDVTTIILDPSVSSVLLRMKSAQLHRLINLSDYGHRFLQSW